MRGLPLTVPWHAAFVERSPYTIHVTDSRADLYRGDEFVSPVKLPRRPRIYDMETADGIPYWKIALLHLDSIASTVVQKCIYWGTEEQCGFCGIELTRGEQTIPVKTPAQLAEVCTAARDYDGAVDVTLTTGSINRRDRGALYISRCAAAIKDASGLPIQVQFEPPDDLAVLEHVRDAGVDAVGIHIETFDPDVLQRVAAGKAKCGVEGYFRCWERAVEVFGRGHVTTYVILGMGERRGADRGGMPARDRDGRVPVRGSAPSGARDADGRHPGARRRVRGLDLPVGVGDARRVRTRPRRGQGGLRSLPGVLGAVGVGAGVQARGGTCPGRAPDPLRHLVSSPRSSAASRRPRTSSTRTSSCGARCSSQSRSCSPTTIATSATTSRRRCTRSACVDGEPCGAVRLYPLEPARLQWKGDRLAVLPELRTNHLGAALVRFAVATAGRLGGARMIAHVQLPNVRFFEHLGWRREGDPAPFHGLDHQLMSIRLDRGA